MLAVPSGCSLLNPNPHSHDSSANLDLMNTSRLGETWRGNGKIGMRANIKARTEGPESIHTGNSMNLCFLGCARNTKMGGYSFCVDVRVCCICISSCFMYELLCNLCGSQQSSCIYIYINSIWWRIHTYHAKQKQQCILFWSVCKYACKNAAWFTFQLRNSSHTHFRSRLINVTWRL